METLKVVLIRCPQPVLATDEGELYSPDRSLTPEPTLPQLAGILQDAAVRHNLNVEVVQLDLRDPANGEIRKVNYGSLQLPYLSDKLNKVYDGVDIREVAHILQDADCIGLTNNFAMSRGVVERQLETIRELCPGKEIWLGGRDVFTDSIKEIYAKAAGNKNLVIFDGHVFESLPAYVRWKMKQEGEPFGVTIYDSSGNIHRTPDKPLTMFASEKGEIRMPLPIYANWDSLAYFLGSGEGRPYPPFGRFAHMTIGVGCPHACGYCTTGSRERFLVHKDMETIQQELELYKKLGVTTLALMDDNLLALGVEKVQEIMGLVNSYGFQIEYGNGLQLSTLLEDWDKLRDPVLGNCVSLYAPLEDLTKNRLYEKLDPTKSQLRLMQMIASEAPETLRYLTMGVIVGVPGHTQKSLETSLMRNIEKFLNVFAGLDLEVAMTVFSFIPLPGTVFGNRALESGRMAVPDPVRLHPEIFNFGTLSYAPEGMTHLEVFNAYLKALDLNPAGRELGIPYHKLQRLGENSLPPNERDKIPPQWRSPGHHLRAKVPQLKARVDKL
jgi:radical SAM superfamily enzyme YgiQ (UPF0313 family)